MAARHVRDVEAPGSNPGIPTAATRGALSAPGGTSFRGSARRYRPATHSTSPTRRSVGSYLRIGRPIQCVRSFDIKIITVMRSCWEKTARRPRITRRWWAPPGTHEENQHCDRVPAPPCHQRPVLMPDRGQQRRSALHQRDLPEQEGSRVCSQRGAGVRHERADPRLRCVTGTNASCAGCAPLHGERFATTQSGPGVSDQS